ncbi:restriction endonuclease subunit S [Geobacillus stearothermophilus]|uniref:restriction endonuclease subunit S n=2 Tax=Geobacillus stearothermophilus TaxID=1422 RepID=UPI002E997DAC|nr:restriction endonuclease subunit S [Geobacillus stearothermophilus]
MNKLYKVVLNKPIIQWVDSVALEANLDNNYYLPKYLETREHLWNSGLEIKTLSTLVNNEGFVTGSTPDYKEKEIKDGAVLLKTVNIERNELNTSKLFYISKENHGKLKKSQLNKGDLVITVIGATDEVIGRAIVYDGRFKNANITQSLAKFRVREQFDGYFVSTFLNSKYGHNLILQMSSSSTRRYVNNTELGQILVPIPSNEIQNYIGNKVRKAEELREEAKRLKEEAEEILFNELRIKELEHLLMEQNKKYNWVEETALTERIDAYYYKAKYTILDKFISQFEYVITKKIADVEYGYMPQEDYTEVDSGIPIIRITNMPGNLLIDSSDIKHIPVNEKIKDRHFVRENDILMVQLGDTTGKVAYVSKEFDGYLFPSFCLKISLKDTNKVLPGYLALLYESKIMQLQIEQTISYASVRPNTTKPAIESLKIPIVEMSKQKEIADRILNYIKHIYESKHLIIEAKQDVEDLIEGKFDESKISEGV